MSACSQLLKAFSYTSSVYLDYSQAWQKREKGGEEKKKIDSDAENALEVAETDGK